MHFFINFLIFFYKTNQKSYNIGNFQSSSLEFLRQEGIKYLRKYFEKLSSSSQTPSFKLDFQFLPIQDAFNLASEYPGSVSMVASQFNCLEFVNPNVVPEDGVTNYIYDHTQGPSCAMSCGAGTGKIF